MRYGSLRSQSRLSFRLATKTLRVGAAHVSDDLLLNGPVASKAVSAFVHTTVCQALQGSPDPAGGCRGLPGTRPTSVQRRVAQGGRQHARCG